MARMTTPERLLSAAEVAEWLGVPTSTLRLWRRQGGGPAAIKVGRLLRYRPSAINDWLDEHSAGGKS